MHRRALLFVVAAVVVMMALPSMAFGLTNEYGMFFAGSNTPLTGCLACHDGALGQTVHGRFAKTGLTPAAPAGWTVFKAAGDPPTVGASNPGSGLPWFSGGGSYPVALNWITLGDFAGGAATEYIFFNGNTSGSTANPWNLVEGLVAEPKEGHPLPIDEGDYVVGAEDPETGLFDVVYGCQRCHMLGTTNKTANAADTAVVPNPTVSTPATYTTPLQWARSGLKTATDFKTDPTVSEAGMSIQCEACHGTGFESSAPTTKHWNSGTQLSHRIPAGTTAPGGTLPVTTVSTLGQSQVCGQCHGSYTNVAGTLGIYGYTPNLPLRLFVNIDGVSGGASYTYTPTEAEFMATPTKWFLFPNGSNARGSHYYYNEWSTSGHAYRGALTSTSPDAMQFQRAGNGHYNAKTSDIKCARCHTGEGYLWSKGSGSTSIPDPSNWVWRDFTPTNDNTGYMGQECTVCHNPHPSGVGAEDVIREPDAAGVRSNTGRATANASMCEDCHNWQNEIMGTTTVPTTTGRGPSHPQRETLHGRSVMFDVADMGEFMPGAKCQECHMPKTNRSANRFSHGMHIMLPGKAEEWMTAASALYAAGYNGEDSCSPCHPGETRDELQANLDEWQGDATAAGDAANTAITAAKLRPEFGTSAGAELTGRAFVNYRAFVNDSSTGAHNPPYVMAGLKVAKFMADSVGGTFDKTYATSSLIVGRIGSIQAHVAFGTGANAVGAKVALEKWNGTSWAQEGAATADENGNVGFMVSPPLGTAKYRLRWDRCANNVADKYSAELTVNVVKTTSKVTIYSSATSIYYGRTFTLKGSVNPANPGAVVDIQAKKGSGSWYKMTTATLSSTSAYSKSIKPNARATWYFRVYYPGTATVASAYSAQVKVVVK